MSNTRRNNRPAIPQAAPKVFVLATRPAAGPPAALVAPPSEDQIRQLAYQKWAAAGSPAGDGAEFWFAAERELRAS